MENGIVDDKALTHKRISLLIGQDMAKKDDERKSDLLKSFNRSNSMKP